MLLHHLFEEGAASAPDAVALIHGRDRWTHAALHEQGARMARFLVEEGVCPGERVGLVVTNSARYIWTYLGVLAAGAVAVPLHAQNDAGTIARMLADCGAVAVLGGERSGARLRAAAASLPSLRLVVLPAREIEGSDGEAPWPERVRVMDEQSVSGHPPRCPEVRLTPEDRATIVYTSGSTGDPRGAVLRHANLVANTRSIVTYLELTAGDRVSVVLPFTYVYGMSLLNTHLAVGGALVLHENLLFAGAVLDTTEAERVTGLAGVPSTFAILLNRSDLADRKWTHLRYVTQAGGAMPVPHIRRLTEALPETRVVIMYGATEASARLSWLPPEMLSEKLGSIGIPIPGVALRIRRPDGADAEIDEVGEVCARGENIMEGYWGAPDATAEVLEDGEFRTGDLGRRDADGYFWLVGRSREMIKVGAHRISPREIEERLLDHEGVHEAAVVGEPEEYSGEIIVAHVTPRAGSALSPESLSAFCQGALPPHKQPQRIEIHRDLPRNANGKVDKRALRGEV